MLPRLGGRIARTSEANDSAYDIVVDAAGTASALEQALRLCRPGGTLLLLATYWDGFELPGFDGRKHFADGTDEKEDRDHDL